VTGRSVLPVAGFATAALASAAAAVSVSRDLPADFGLGPVTVRGHRGGVLRDFLGWRGTAIAPPLPLILGIAALSVAARRRRKAARLLGAVGAAGVLGYAGEPRAREVLAPSGADPVETPLVGACLAGCAVLALLGLGSR
jgi:hypothetical protein